MKKKFNLVLLFVLILMFSSCKKNVPIEADNYEKINKKLAELKTYEADADVKYISNKNSNTYKTKQFAKISGEYRVEVIEPQNAAGSTTVFDGNQISQFNKRLADKINISKTDTLERSEIFLTAFIKNYLTSSEVAVSVSKIDDSQYTVLEANIPGEHPYLRSEKLWINNDTLEPSKMIIYDNDNTERIVVTFNSFGYNKELADNLFKGL